MNNICVAIDFSDAMPYVLSEAVKIARPAQSMLHLVHVIESSPAYGMYGFSPEEIPMVGPSTTEVRAAIENRLESIREELSTQGIFSKITLIDGSPLEELLHYINTEKMDMLVVGSHGHGFLASMLLGSVAEGAIRKSKIPVLVVPSISEKK